MDTWITTPMDIFEKAEFEFYQQHPYEIRFTDYLAWRRFDMCHNTVINNDVGGVKLIIENITPEARLWLRSLALMIVEATEEKTNGTT